MNGTSPSESSIYEEQQSAFVLYAAIYAAAILVFLAGFIFGHAQVIELIPAIIVLLLFPLIVWGMGRMKVIVTPTELRFGYPLWRKRIPLNEVTAEEVVRIPFWYGVGVHFIGRRWIFNAHWGRGVSITVGKRIYLIGSDQPERLQSILRERIGLLSRS